MQSLIRATAQRQHYSHLAQPLSFFYCLPSHFLLHPLFPSPLLHTSYLSDTVLSSHPLTYSVTVFDSPHFLLIIFFIPTRCSFCHSPSSLSSRFSHFLYLSCILFSCSHHLFPHLIFAFISSHFSLLLFTHLSSPFLSFPLPFFSYTPFFYSCTSFPSPLSCALSSALMSSPVFSSILLISSPLSSFPFSLFPLHPSLASSHLPSCILFSHLFKLLLLQLLSRLLLMLLPSPCRVHDLAIFLYILFLCFYSSPFLSHLIHIQPLVFTPCTLLVTFVPTFSFFTFLHLLPSCLSFGEYLILEQSC